MTPRDRLRARAERPLLTGRITDAQRMESQETDDARKLLALVEACEALQATFMAPNKSWGEIVHQIIAVSEATFTITTHPEAPDA